MLFEVNRDLAEHVVLRYRPSASEIPGADGTPVRVWRDNHVVAGLEVPSSQLREKQRLTLELWTAEGEPYPLWRREVVIDRLDRQQGLHHLSLSPDTGPHLDLTP
jgi:hypothetical protein